MVLYIGTGDNNVCLYIVLSESEIVHLYLSKKIKKTICKFVSNQMHWDSTEQVMQLAIKELNSLQLTEVFLKMLAHPYAIKC